jgi:hypothetical protein
MRRLAASLVKHALFGQEQRLLQSPQRHSVQRLKATPELPMGRVSGRLAGYQPAAGLPRPDAAP